MTMTVLNNRLVCNIRFWNFALISVMILIKRLASLYFTLASGIYNFLCLIGTCGHPYNNNSFHTQQCFIN